VAPDENRVTPVERLLTVSGATGFDNAQRQAYLDSAVAFVQSQAHEIDLPEQQRVTLTSHDGELPLLLQNRLDYPVRVKIVLSSDKVDFSGASTFESTLQPGDNRIPIPLSTRASGAFPINVAVSSPDDVLPMTSGRLPVRSTAISGIGLALTIGAGLFLAIWWARHFRSVRRSRRLVSVEGHPSSPNADREVRTDDEEHKEPV